MSSGWSWPLTRLVCTDEYGMRFHPIYQVMRLHRGIDLAASKNDRVYCTAEGRVSWANYNGGEGNSVHVVHPDGSKTKYFHNTSIAVSVGQVVHEGTLLAYAGTTGDSTGVHVHFETHDNANADSPVNPRDFMAFRGAPFGSAPASGGNSSPIDPGKSPEEQELDYLMTVADNIVNDLKARLKETEARLAQVLQLILAQLNNDDAQVERILNAIRRESRPRLYQINQPGHPQHTLAAAIDIDEGYFRSFGSLAALQNAIRLQEVSPETPLQITADEFFAKKAAADARLDAVNGLDDADLGELLPFTSEVKALTETKAA